MNKKIITLFSLALAMPMIGLSAAEEKPAPPSEADILREQIEQLMQRINQNTQIAQTAYKEAAAASNALRDETQLKLKDLALTIKTAETSKVTNKDLLKKAQDLQKTAQNYFQSKKYRAALAVASNAFEFITDVPLVSTTLNPRLFSPDGDGSNDDLVFETSIKAKNPISGWELRIMRSEPGDTDIEVFSTGGKGEPTRFIWKGERNGHIAVDSATNYYAELTVTDNKGGKGDSGRLNFKTDIFVNKTERGLLIDITSIKFDPDKAVLLPENYPIIQTIRQFLLKYPEYRVIVEGHAHYSGKASWSKTLSDQRSKAVMDYLVSLGMEKDRIISQGMGETLPRSFTKGEEPLNRRVAFILIKTNDEMQAYQNFIKSLNFNKEFHPPK